MDEITVVSFIVIGAALLLPVLSEILEEHHRLLKYIKYLIFAVYLFANLYETLLFRTITPKSKCELDFLWSYREALNIRQSGGLRILITNRWLLKEIILNILLYIPLGCLLPFMRPALARKRPKPVGAKPLRRRYYIFPWKVVLIGFFYSIATETLQMVFRVGLFELDDIFDNTVGCVIGAMIYSELLRRHARRHEERPDP